MTSETKVYSRSSRPIDVNQRLEVLQILCSSPKINLAGDKDSLQHFKDLFEQAVSLVENLPSHPEN